MKHILVKVSIAGKLLYNIYVNVESTNICFNPNKESILFNVFKEIFVGNDVLITY